MMFPTWQDQLIKLGHNDNLKNTQPDYLQLAVKRPIFSPKQLNFKFIAVLDFLAVAQVIHSEAIC